MTASADQIGAGTARGLAGIALLLGVACAVVNGWFFALGLERLEPDAAARAPLLLAGWLMVASEHVAVGLAALLPVAFAELGAVDASLQPLGFEQAMADSRWCLVIIERARKFQS